jgi:hypothetical protein
MKKLHLEQTRNTPLVLLDPCSGTFVVAGNSMPENAIGFYEPVVAWLEEYLSKHPPLTRWEFRLAYFNTSSMKGIYQILASIKASQKQGAGHHVVWDVVDDDEFMLESGQTFQELLGIDVEFRELSQEDADARTERVLRSTVN